MLVNSLGGTPGDGALHHQSPLRQRLRARGVRVHTSLVGHYYTSLDMAGMSISLLHLDDELQDLLAHPCRTPALSVG